MFERILVPLDGSQRAASALPVAARLARATGGTVLLVEVVRGTAEFEVGVVPPETWAPAADPAERKHAFASLKRVAASADLAGVATETGVYAGPAAATLLLIAERQRADLIVMTTRGRSGLARWALGSVAQKVAHQSPAPVLLLRDQGPSPLGSAGHVHGPLRALVPLDGSELAEAALLPAARLVGALAAPGPAALHLIRVVDLLDLASLPDHWGDARRPAEVRAREWAVRQAKAYLSDVAARLRADLGDRPPTLTWSVAVNPEAFTYVADVASMIVQAAEVGEPTEGAAAPERCDLIAMATHGYSGLTHLIAGSVAERVLHASALPLLLVRPRGDGSARPRPDAAVSES